MQFFFSLKQIHQFSVEGMKKLEKTDEKCIHIFVTGVKKGHFMEYEHFYGSGIYLVYLVQCNKNNE